MSVALQAPHLPQVRNQYENFPYPARNPAEERQKLFEPYPNHLDKIAFHCFEGARDFKHFRALDAGGGTGDNAIFLAEQLRDIGGEVVYVDFSGASKEIAEARAKNRGLTNITFLHDSLLNLPNLGLAPFDYITCIGVLHHLEDPDEGLKALRSVLAPGGAMSLMVYATYGRLAIYPLQEALRLIAPPSMDAEDRLRIARNLMAQLPRPNIFHHSTWFHEEIKTHGNTGIYDLLLHTQDRSYTVDEIYDWLALCDLHLLTFLNEFGHAAPALKPEYFIADPEILARLNALAPRERQAFVELIAGNIGKHSLYAGATPRVPPTPDRLDMIPFIPNSTFAPNIYGDLAAFALANPGQPYGVRYEGINLAQQLRATPHTGLIYKHMDGTRCLRDIFALVRRDAGADAPSESALIEEFSYIFKQLNEYEWMYLHARQTQRVDYDVIRHRFGKLP